MTQKSLPDEIDLLRKELYGLMASFHKEKARMEASYIDNLRGISSNFMALDPQHLDFVKNEVKNHCQNFLTSVLDEKVATIFFRLLKRQVSRCPKCGGYLRPGKKEFHMLHCETCDFFCDRDLVLRNEAGATISIAPEIIAAALWGGNK